MAVPVRLPRIASVLLCMSGSLSFLVLQAKFLRVGSGGRRLDDQASIQSDQGGSPKDKAQIPITFLALGNTEEVAAFQTHTQGVNEHGAVTQPGEVQVAAALLPHLLGHHLLDLLFPEPGLQHVGEVVRGPFGDQ
ncbi:hypothetical protein FQZ97_1158350 [compost metagenome]